MPNSQQWVLYWCYADGLTAVYGPYTNHAAATDAQLALTRAYSNRYRSSAVLPLQPPFVKKAQ